MKRKSFLTALTLLPFWSVLSRPFVVLAAACRTQRDQEGPFYKAGSPSRSLIETEGTPLTIQGRVFSAADCTTPIAGAEIDIWHCDIQGNYDNDGFKCRGIVKTDAEGKYQFTTIYPPPYGSRPRHIHFKVRAKGYPEFTSQIYFKGDPNIKNDFARNAESARVIELNHSNKALSGRFNIFV